MLKERLKKYTQKASSSSALRFMLCSDAVVLQPAWRLCGTLCLLQWPAAQSLELMLTAGQAVASPVSSLTCLTCSQSG